MKTTISVLIPTYNAGNYIVDLLNKLYEQELQKDEELEIIIVDSSSADQTEQLVKSGFPNVTFVQIPNKKFDHGGTRNDLASLSHGDYLLFMTQDAIPVDTKLIRNLVNHFHDDSEVKVSFARQIPRDDASLLEKFARGFNYPAETVIKDKSKLETLGIKTFFNSNVCSMYEAKTFKETGGFPEKVILNEDMIYASGVILNGAKIVYAAEAKVFHSHNYHLAQQFKRYFDIGMAFDQTQYLLEHASNEKEGMRMVLNQLNYLLKNRGIHLIPYAIVETGMKYTGYLLGKKHKKIPLKMKRKLSAYMK